MPIIGFNVDKIQAEKKKSTNGKVDIKNTPKIEKLELSEIKGLAKGVDKCIKVKYDFSTTYEPKVGQIKFTGEILYLHEDQENIVKAWKKDKSIPSQMMLELLNFMFKKFITRSLSIAEELQLPPSIPFPSAQVQKGSKKETQEKKDTKYIG